MRRKRLQLQVNTFPFLAVLLGAMGALILVLLVMDRRAKAVARAKAMQTIAQSQQDQEHEEAARRAEWERRRQELHAGLLRQEQQLRGEMLAMLDYDRAAAIEGRRREESARRLHQKVDVERTAVARLEQELAAGRGRRSEQQAKVDAGRVEVARLRVELGELERTAAEVKTAHSRAQRTYSVVPYAGTRGDARRPIYVECAAGGLIFHPDRKTIVGEELSGVEIRAEVEKRLAVRASPNDPSNKKEDDAYLLFLVRPHGITSYYVARDALKGVEGAFGYELIDDDWVLDFPPHHEATPSQPWMTASATKPATGATGAAPPGSGGTSQSPPRGVVYGGGAGSENSGGSAGIGRTGDGAGITPPSLNQGLRGLPGGAGLDLIRDPRQGGVGSNKENGSSSGSSGTETPASAAQGSPSGDRTASGAGNASEPPPTPEFPFNPNPGSANSAAATNPQQPSSHSPSTGAPRATEGGTPGENDTQQPGTPNDANTPAERVSGATGSTGNDSGSSGAGEPRQGKDAPRQVRQVSNRDWIIQIECTAGTVIVHPTRLRIPTTALVGARGKDNPLLQTLEQMIARRQTAVRPGDPPYRPQIRFLIRPDGLRAFHLAYPALEKLQLPMTRQDVERGVDVGG